MRQLSRTFLSCLNSGFLSELTDYVRNDHDLNLEIRDGYINVYYKGNSLLKLAEAGSLLHYKGDIHKKFLEGLDVSLDFTEETAPRFIKNIPWIKENITKYGQNSLELEYEQMIIRANNFEPRNNTEYFIVDKQYVINDGRFDLTGFYWSRDSRQTNRSAQVCLMEIKFALNQDIQDLHAQLTRYYDWIKDHAAQIAEELEMVFKQKLALKLYDQDTKRINAMKTLTFSNDINDFQFIIVLVDYNPNSTRLSLEKIRALPFADQIRVFYAGFGMWQDNVKPI
jgi:hypothetical protein